MSDLSEKVKTSIERLKAFEPKNGEGYYLAFSGGKDSVVCKALLDMAGVKYDSTYRVTSVDPPELVQFIKAESVPYCGLYDEGLHRLGCIGCPMATQRGREKEFLRWPKYKAMYLRAFDKMLELRKERNRLDPSRPVWKTGGAVYAEPTALDVYNMWMEYKIIPGQLDLFDMMDEEDDE